MKDYYQLLELSPEVSLLEIRKAFRREAKKTHPDLYQGQNVEEKQKRQKKFVLLTQAYETLIDPESRREYDRKHRILYSRAKFTKDQKTRSTSSHSSQSTSQTKSSYQQTRRPSVSVDEPEETLEDLLQDIEQLLSRFGMTFKDPLEMLVDWARQVFQDLVEAWNEAEIPSENQQTQQTKPSSHERTTSAFESIEEELQRLKQQHQGSDSPHQQRDLKPKSTTRSQTSSDIDNELKNLKKKYGKL